MTVAALSEDAVARGQTGAVSCHARRHRRPGTWRTPRSNPGPAGDTSVRVEIPVENITAGTVAVLVTADGGSEIVQTSVATESRGGSHPLRRGDGEAR